MYHLPLAGRWLVLGVVSLTTTVLMTLGIAAIGMRSTVSADRASTTSAGQPKSSGVLLVREYGGVPRSPTPTLGTAPTVQQEQLAQPPRPPQQAPPAGPAPAAPAPAAADYIGSQPVGQLRSEGLLTEPVPAALPYQPATTAGETTPRLGAAAGPGSPTPLPAATSSPSPTPGPTFTPIPVATIAALAEAFAPGMSAVMPPPPMPEPTSAAPTATARPAATATPARRDVPPSVTILLSSGRAEVGDSVTVTVVGNDDVGLEEISWGGEAVTDRALERERYADCGGKIQCAQVWTISPARAGSQTLYARARDVNGQRSEPASITLRVRD